MRLRILALALAYVLFLSPLVLSPLAMAGELSSSDTNFLFSKNRVVATTISTQEMQDTQGQLLDNLIILPLFSTIVGSADGSTINACPTALLGGGCAIVSGLL